MENFKEFVRVLSENENELNSSRSPNYQVIKELVSYIPKLLRNKKYLKQHCDEFVCAIKKYIEYVLQYISYQVISKKNILIIKKCLQKIPPLFQDVELKNVFVVQISQLIFDFVLEPNSKPWFAKEVLKMYNSCIAESSRHLRQETIKNIKTMYMYKFIDTVNTYADYEYQSTILETVFRMCSEKFIHKNAKEFIPESKVLSEALSKFNTKLFDESVRTFLNLLNVERKGAFSVIASAIFLDNLRFLEPTQTTQIGGIWVDFDTKEGSLIWTCDNTNLLDESPETKHYQGWETITLYSCFVKSVSITRSADLSKLAIIFELEGSCITASENLQNSIDKFRKLKILITNSEKIEFIITSILPVMFDKKFLNNPMKLPLKKVYKPLNITQKNTSKRKSFSVNTSAISVFSETTSALNSSKTKNSSECDKANIRKVSAPISIDSEYTEDDNHNLPFQESDFQTKTSRTIRLKSNSTDSVTSDRFVAETIRKNIPEQNSTDEFFTCNPLIDEDFTKLTDFEKRKVSPPKLSRSVLDQYENETEKFVSAESGTDDETTNMQATLKNVSHMKRNNFMEIENNYPSVGSQKENQQQIIPEKIDDQSVPNIKIKNISYFNQFKSISEDSFVFERNNNILLCDQKKVNANNKNISQSLEDMMVSEHHPSINKDPSLENDSINVEFEADKSVCEIDEVNLNNEEQGHISQTEKDIFSQSVYLGSQESKNELLSQKSVKELTAEMHKEKLSVLEQCSQSYNFTEEIEKNIASIDIHVPESKEHEIPNEKSSKKSKKNKKRRTKKNKSITKKIKKVKEVSSDQFTSSDDLPLLVIKNKLFNDKQKTQPIVTLENIIPLKSIENKIPQSSGKSRKKTKNKENIFLNKKIKERVSLIQNQKDENVNPSQKLPLTLPSSQDRVPSQKSITTDNINKNITKNIKVENLSVFSQETYKFHHTQEEKEIGKKLTQENFLNVIPTEVHIDEDQVSPINKKLSSIHSSLDDLRADVIFCESENESNIKTSQKVAKSVESDIKNVSNDSVFLKSDDEEICMNISNAQEIKENECATKNIVNDNDNVSVTTTNTTKRRKLFNPGDLSYLEDIINKTNLSGNNLDNNATNKTKLTPLKLVQEVILEGNDDIIFESQFSKASNDIILSGNKSRTIKEVERKKTFNFDEVIPAAVTQTKLQQNNDKQKKKAKKNSIHKEKTNKRKETKKNKEPKEDKKSKKNKTTFDYLTYGNESNYGNLNSKSAFSFDKILDGFKQNISLVCEKPKHKTRIRTLGKRTKPKKSIDYLMRKKSSSSSESVTSETKLVVKNNKKEQTKKRIQQESDESETDLEIIENLDEKNNKKINLISNILIRKRISEAELVSDLPPKRPKPDQDVSLPEVNDVESPNKNGFKDERTKKTLLISTANLFLDLKPNFEVSNSDIELDFNNICNLLKKYYKK